jgi:Uma2 family endonuclease
MTPALLEAPVQNPIIDLAANISQPEELVTDQTTAISLEEYSLNPPERTEFVNGNIIEKTGMGFFHGRVQVKFVSLLLDFIKANQIGGVVLTEVLCRTQKQARRPDVAYMSAQQVENYGKTDFTVLPECFPLIVEVVSPTDTVDDVFAKTEEYLGSGAQEVWLLFPKSRLIMMAYLEESEEKSEVQWNLFANNQQATSLKVLSGFSVNINELLP